MTVCLIVPGGRWDLAPLVAAIRVHRPDRPIVAVWCGDPHRRPTLPASIATWCDRDLDAPSAAGWNRLLVGMAERTFEWARTAAAVARLLEDGAGAVTVLRVGSVAVLGDIDAISCDAAITLLQRVDTPLPLDGLSPTEADVVELGRFSTVVAQFSDAAQPALRWFAEHLVADAGSGSEVGPWLQRMAELFESDVFASAVVAAAGWPHPPVSTPAVLDLDHIDRGEPWHVGFGNTPARLRLSDDLALAAAVGEGWRHCTGAPESVRLPGAIPVAGPVRALMSRALRAHAAGTGDLPPEPLGPDNSAFTNWLEQSEPSGVDIGRYWLEVREQRSDLQAAFPQPQAADASAYLQWADASWRLEDRPAVLRGYAGATFADPLAGDPLHAIESTGFDPTGINVLGYLDFDQSQGHIARQVVAALQAADVPVASLNHHRSLGSKRPTPVAGDRKARYATNLVVVNADQFLFVEADHGQSLLRGRHTIAYWFWELEHVPAAMVRAIDHVDEIWTGSQFVADAFSAVTDKPVRCVPLPVAEPRPSSRTRTSFGIDDDRFVFLTTFDQFSVPERKNPFGVIDAFSNAFADGEGPLLWIKTMNGTRGWRNHERLLLAASQRSDIVVWDEHLSRPDQMAVLAAADCLVSLHRSEGLGLHCAEAMWLAKPVIATRYSGNLDFMDDSCAALVGYDMVPVRHGEGIYPDDATWADPHVEEAAAWMRRLVDEPGLAADLGRRARDRMQSQPTAAESGRSMARLAGLEHSITRDNKG